MPDYDKRQASDFVSFLLYLEGVRVPLNDFSVKATINSIPQGYVDIPYDEQFINIKFRLEENSSLNGIQPYTRLHLFSVINNGTPRLLVAGVVTGVGVLTLQKKVIRLNFMGEFGLLATESLLPYIPVPSMSDYIIGLNPKAQKDKTATLTEADSMAMVMNGATEKSLNEIKEAVKAYFKEGDGFPSSDFVKAFISHNYALNTLNKFLKLENSISIYNNKKIYSYMNIDITDNKDMPTLLDGLIDDLVSVQIPKANNNTKPFTLFTSVLRYLGLNYVPILNPINFYGGYLNGIAIPDLTFFDPARGNLFFSDMTGIEALPQYNFVNAPTRVFMSYIAQSGAQRRSFVGLAPLSLRQSIRKKAKEDLSIDITSDKATDLTAFMTLDELMYGQNVLQVPLDTGLAQILTSNPLLFNINTAEGREASKAIQGYLNARADYIYRQGYREISKQVITLKRFDPFVCLGLPGAIIGDDEISVGLVEGVAYQGTANGGVVTSVEFSGLHSYKGYTGDKNPLMSTEDKADVGESIYDFYYDTTLQNANTLGTIRARYKQSLKTSVDSAVHYATTAINNRGIIGINEVDEYLNGHLLHPTCENLMSSIGSYNKDNIKYLNISSSATFVCERREQVENYVKRIRAK